MSGALLSWVPIVVMILSAAASVGMFYAQARASTAAIGSLSRKMDDLGARMDSAEEKASRRAGDLRHVQARLEDTAHDVREVRDSMLASGLLEPKRRVVRSVIPDRDSDPGSETT